MGVYGGEVLAEEGRDRRGIGVLRRARPDRYRAEAPWAEGPCMGGVVSVDWGEFPAASICDA